MSTNTLVVNTRYHTLVGRLVHVIQWGHFDQLREFKQRGGDPLPIYNNFCSRPYCI